MKKRATGTACGRVRAAVNRGRRRDHWPSRHKVDDEPPPLHMPSNGCFPAPGTQEVHSEQPIDIVGTEVEDVDRKLVSMRIAVTSGAGAMASLSNRR